MSWEIFWQHQHNAMLKHRCTTKQTTKTTKSYLFYHILQINMDKLSNFSDKETRRGLMDLFSLATGIVDIIL